jgi:hypothetical protein
VLKDAANTDGWLELSAFYYKKLKVGWLPFHFELYWDAFDQLRQRKENGTGMYIRFAGDTKGKIYPLTVIPPHAKLFEALDHIVDDLLVLEDRITVHFRVSKKVQPVFGALQQAIGTCLLVCVLN